MSLSNSEQTRLQTRYGPWALVTGASSGIGRELARQLAGCGLHLVLVARRREALEAVAQECRQLSGGQVRVVVADVGTPAGIRAIFEETAPLNLGLVVAAAGYGTSGPFTGSVLDEEVDLLRVNAEAVLRLAHHYAGVFARQGRGGLILLSSIVAFQGVPFSANYAATKAYVQSLAEALARELKPRGVDVLAAAPGPVRSGFAARARMVLGAALTPEEIGVPILRALGRQTTVLPGRLTKLLIYALRTVPRWGKVRIMQQVMAGMTKHQT
jgi:short-subunit dehydrogenase